MGVCLLTLQTSKLSLLSDLDTADVGLLLFNTPAWSEDAAAMFSVANLGSMMITSGRDGSPPKARGSVQQAVSLNSLSNSAGCLDYAFVIMIYLILSDAV